MNNREEDTKGANDEVVVGQEHALRTWDRYDLVAYLNKYPLELEQQLEALVGRGTLTWRKLGKQK
ncbi:hypothetical protein YC2023_105710 [Brassica napus]